MTAEGSKPSEADPKTKVEKTEVKGKLEANPNGIRSLRTTAAFRAVNFELYAKPVRIIT